MCRCVAVEPATTVPVTAVEGGQVEQVMALDGSEVAAGAPLARLANPQLKLAVVSKEAEIAGRMGDVSGQELALQKAQADRERELAQATYDGEVASRNLDRRQSLHDIGFESDAALKTAVDDEAYNRSRLAALQTGGAREAQIGADQHARVRALSGRLNNDNLRRLRPAWTPWSSRRADGRADQLCPAARASPEGRETRSAKWT